MIAHDREDLSGQQIGNYELVSHIADHQVSDLFLARDVKLERLVYLELLRTSLEEESELAAAFERRMETVSQIKHENIGVVSDVDVTEDGHPYAVIEYFPAVTLAEKLDDLADAGDMLSTIDSLELTKEMALGLSAAHSAELVHHDLRPSNIFLTEDGTPVFVDFGVPVTLPAQQAVLGVADAEMLDYAAPEEMEGKALTRRSNIYSLGVVLYELLAGHRPKLPELPFDIFPQANMPKEEPLEDARPGLAGETYRLVRNCLWRQEWSRYETADEMLTAIETAIFAEQELPNAAAWAPSRSRSLVFLVPIAIIALAALGFLAVRSLRGGSDVADSGAGLPTMTVEAVAGEGDPDDPAAGGLVGVETPDPVMTSTLPPSPTVELPTEAPFDFTISVLAPVPNREFTRQETINFDWFWPTLPEPGEQFSLYLIDGNTEYLIDSLTEPNNGSAYRVRVDGEQLPTDNEELQWQVRLESIASGEINVASDLIPIIVRALLPTATATLSPTATATPSPTPTESVCIVSPPSGWSIYLVRQGDALARLAQNANLPIATVMRVNCLENDLLSVGQQLWLPGPPATATPALIATTAPQPTSPPSGGNNGGGSNPPPPTAVPTTVPATDTALPQRSRLLQRVRRHGCPTEEP